MNIFHRCATIHNIINYQFGSDILNSYRCPQDKHETESTVDPTKFPIVPL